MSNETYEKWTTENCTRKVCDEWINGIHYHFWEMKDKWIAVFQWLENSGEYGTVVQACDINKAKSFCGLREPVTVPMQALC